MIKKIIYKISGVESIYESLNPIFYLSKLFTKIFVKINGKKIINGPFTGMELKHSSRGSEYMPKYLGTYESELYKTINSFCSNNNNKLIIDIGADDGYYSIGIAKLINKGTILSYELNSESCIQLKRNIDLNRNFFNNQKKIEVINKKLNDYGDLKQFLKNNDFNSILVKVDIEGGEYELFTDDFVNSLSALPIMIIIETHFDPNAELKLIKRLKSFSFEVNVIDKVMQKFLSKTFNLNFISKSILSLFWLRWTNEHRPKYNRWIIAKINK